MKGYWFKEGYVRTSSYEYQSNFFDNYSVHLTNDSIQKKDEFYGKYETGNKITLFELD